MNILNVEESILDDESITRYEFHTLLPYSSTSVNNNDEIRIPLHQQDILTLPCESRIYIEGTLKKGSKDAYQYGDGLSDNAMAHLFREIRYELHGIVIDLVRNPGITSCLKGLVSLTENESERYKNSSYALDDPERREEAFSFCVPLKLLLGFAEDFKKILINVKQELVLVRSRTNLNALIDSVGDKDLSLTLNTVQWQVPFISVNDSYRLKLLGTLKKNIPLPIAFRSWQLYEYPNIPSSTSSMNWPIRMVSSKEKPRFAIIGFQTERSESKTKSCNVFDQCSIRQIRLFIGSECYPYNPLQADFDKHHFAQLYENYANFRKQYYMTGDDGTAPSISSYKFLNFTPIWVIDCSRQNELVKTGGVDIRLEITAKQNFPAKTTAYCLLISDCLFEYTPLTGIIHKIM